MTQLSSSNTVTPNMQVRWPKREATLNEVMTKKIPAKRPTSRIEGSPGYLGSTLI